MLIQLDAVGKIVFNQKLNFSTHCLAPDLQDQKLCLHSLNRVPRSSGIWCRHGISPTLKSTASIQSSRVDNKSFRSTLFEIEEFECQEPGRQLAAASHGQVLQIH